MGEERARQGDLNRGRMEKVQKKEKLPFRDQWMEVEKGIVAVGMEIVAVEMWKGLRCLWKGWLQRWFR